MTAPGLTRVGRLVLDGPISAHTHATGEVTLEGLACHGSLVHAVWFREQLAALADNPDEPVVPVSTPGGWQGYGMVLGASVEPLAMSEGYQRWTVTVAPVRNAKTPQVESAMLLFLRSNSHSLTQAGYVHGVPGPATSYSWLPHAGSIVQVVRTTDPVSPAARDVIYRAVGNANGASEASWSVPPADYYAGGCYAQALVGPDWAPLVGRQSLPAGRWRISNGLVRAGVDDAGRFSLDWYRPDHAGDHDGWTPPQLWRLRRTNTPAVSNWAAWTAAELTELSAHKVTVRLTGRATDGMASVWMSIRRGTRTVAFYVDQDLPSPSPAWDPEGDVTGITDGTYYAQGPTIPDAGGLRWLYMTPGTFTISAAGTMVPAGNPATLAWGVTATLTGEALAAATVAREWYTPISERVVFA